MSRLVDQIKRHEGFRRTVYTCPAGKQTIGYGRNLEDRGITEAEADMLLRNDIGDVRRELARSWAPFARLDEVRRDALVNMAFNMGVGGLLKFRRMLAALEAGEYATAAAEALDSRWARQVGNRAEEIAGQIRAGEWGTAGGQAA